MVSRRFDWAGISIRGLEVVTCQLIFVVIVLITTWKNRENSHDHKTNYRRTFGLEFL